MKAKNSFVMMVTCVLCLAMASILTPRAIANPGTPPTTTVIIGQPKYNTTETTFVIPDTPFTFDATDPDLDLNCTFYKVYNITLPGVWQEYTAPFSLLGLKNGNYTIAYYSIDLENNVEEIKEENVTLCRASDNLGDVTGDGIVDIYDITMICVAYDSELGDLNWNPVVDLCQEDWSKDTINIFDIVTCVQYYED